MYATIRRYRTEAGREATRSASRHFLHAMRQAPGLVNYYVIDSGNGEWTSVSVFETRQAAERANAMAAEFIHREGKGELMGEPEVTQGEVALHTP